MSNVHLSVTLRDGQWSKNTFLNYFGNLSKHSEPCSTLNNIPSSHFITQSSLCDCTLKLWCSEGLCWSLSNSCNKIHKTEKNLTRKIPFWSRFRMAMEKDFTWEDDLMTKSYQRQESHLSRYTISNVLPSLNIKYFAKTFSNPRQKLWEARGGIRVRAQKFGVSAECDEWGG